MHWQFPIHTFFTSFSMENILFFLFQYIYSTLFNFCIWNTRRSERKINDNVLTIKFQFSNFIIYQYELNLVWLVNHGLNGVFYSSVYIECQLCFTLIISYSVIYFHLNHTPTPHNFHSPHTDWFYCHFIPANCWPLYLLKLLFYIQNGKLLLLVHAFIIIFLLSNKISHTYNLMHSLMITSRLQNFSLCLYSSPTFRLHIEIVKQEIR